MTRFTAILSVFMLTAMGMGCASENAQGLQSWEVVDNDTLIDPSMMEDIVSATGRISKNQGSATISATAFALDANYALTVGHFFFPSRKPGEKRDSHLENKSCDGVRIEWGDGSVSACKALVYAHHIAGHKERNVDVALVKIDKSPSYALQVDDNDPEHNEALAVVSLRTQGNAGLTAANRGDAGLSAEVLVCNVQPVEKGNLARMPNCQTELGKSGAPVVDKSGMVRGNMVGYYEETLSNGQVTRTGVMQLASVIDLYGN